MREIEALTTQSNSKCYEEVVALLVDLRELAVQLASKSFGREHARKTTLIRRMDQGTLGED